MALRKLILSKTGDFDSVAAGAAVNGNAITIGDGARLKIKGLSALVTVDAETNTITLAAKWQVSNDNSTWYDVANGTQNAAAVVLATGTGGADAAVTKVIPAPDAVYGWVYARLSIVVGVTTGTTSDTYTIAYSCRSVRGVE